ncbi:MAG: sulfatase-like hydrolase/transferase [Alphaproteobacteria bacterium]
MVLIVGETARAQNFSLYGYGRETNPLLSKNKEIVTFGDVSSCGTATAVSLPCMFSHLTRKNFDVTDAQYTQNLLDIAKASGYDVFWKDNDDGCKRCATG